jgi:hypothetical protein
MRCDLLKFTAASAVLLSLTASAAWAFPPSNPYTPGPADIQGMLDRTGDFSGNSQATTSTSSNIPRGVELDVTWSTGTAFVNESFTRVVKSQRFPSDNGDGDGGDLDAFDGVAWNFLSDTAVAVKPYSQDWDNFSFHEGDQPNVGCGVGVICVPANTPTLVTIDWDDVGGTFGPDRRTNVFEVGFQIFGPSPPQDGSTVRSVIQITSLIPEPASVALASFAGIALVAVSSRRRQK